MSLRNKPCLTLNIQRLSKSTKISHLRKTHSWSDCDNKVEPASDMLPVIREDRWKSQDFSVMTTVLGFVLLYVSAVSAWKKIASDLWTTIVNICCVYIYIYLVFLRYCFCIKMFSQN